MVKHSITAFRNNHTSVSNLSNFVAEKLCHRVEANPIEVNGRCPVVSKMIIFANGAGYHSKIQFSYKRIQPLVELAAELNIL